MLFIADAFYRPYCIIIIIIIIMPLRLTHFNKYLE